MGVKHEFALTMPDFAVEFVEPWLLNIFLLFLFVAFWILQFFAFAQTAAGSHCEANFWWKLISGSAFVLVPL